jgi:signal transduction histidine kinase
MEEKGILRTSVLRDGDVPRFSISDNGPGLQGKSTHSGHGIGLRNAVERLAYLYAQKYFFSSQEPQTAGFEVVISIPYERA